MSTIYLVMREGVHPPYREEVEAAYTDRELAQEFRERREDEEDDMEPHRDYRFWVRPFYLDSREAIASTRTRPLPEGDDA